MTKKTGGRPGERGQAILIAVLAMTVLLGFTAMAIDIGMFFEDRRHLQNSADAMALAGVQELPLDPAGAMAKANEWAANNDIDPSEIQTVEVRTKSFPSDTLYVELDREFSWIFGRVLGKTATNVGASAAAQTGSLRGGHDAMPWALLQGESPCLDVNGDALYTGAPCSVKVGAGSAITGWYGALDYDGNGGGSAEYQSNIIDGETASTYCVVSEFASPCDSATVHALSGNKVGGTGAGIEERLAAEPTAGCSTDGDSTDDFGEVFVPNPGGDPTYLVNCPDSQRLVIIPIVSVDQNPVHTVTIHGWSLAYLWSYSCVGAQSCNGAKGHWEVQIEIVDAVYSQAAGFLTAYDPDSGIIVRRLVE